MLQQKKWQRQSVKFQNNLSVYVAGLPPQTSYWDLRGALSQFGEVCATFVSTLKPQQTHKYGFGCFKSRSAVERAAQSELVVHGAVVTIRRRTKSNWKRVDADSQRSGSAAPEAAAFKTHASSSAMIRYSDRDINCLRHPQNASIIHHMNSLPPISPFVHPPEFTEFVHDTIASQCRTKGRLQAAIQPRVKQSAEPYPDSHQDERAASKIGGKVARVDGIPASWQAVDLFGFLNEHGVPVTNVLVYDDFDERGLRQALIQLVSNHATNSLCNVGSLHSLNVQLRFASSCVQSIGPVRRTYGGNFTAYSHRLRNTEAYGYSVAEPSEPSADDASIQVKASDIPLACWPTAVTYPRATSERGSVSSRSSGDDLETPATVVGPGSPKLSLTADVHEDQVVQAGYSGENTDSTAAENASQQQYATSFFMPKNAERSSCCSETRGRFEEMQVSVTNPVHPQARNAPFCCPPRFPMIFPKASQTVIVDNFDSRLIGDSENLCNWVSQFGDVQNLDLVPMDERRTRAYISYTSPLDAQYTMHHLQLCMSGSFRLMVRLA